MENMHNDVRIKCDFFNDVYFFSWTSNFNIYVKSALLIWHIAGEPYNWLIVFDQKHEGQ